MTNILEYPLVNGYIHNWLVAGPVATEVKDLERFTGADFKLQIAQHYHDAELGINGEPAGFLNMGYLTRPEPGSRVRVRVERSGRTEEMELVPDERDAVQYAVEPDPEASAEALKRQAAWLGAS